MVVKTGIMFLSSRIGMGSNQHNFSGDFKGNFSQWLVQIESADIFAVHCQRIILLLQVFSSVAAASLREQLAPTTAYTALELSRPGPSFMKPGNFTRNDAVNWSQLTTNSQCSLRPVS